MLFPSGDNILQCPYFFSIYYLLISELIYQCERWIISEAEVILAVSAHCPEG